MAVVTGPVVGVSGEPLDGVLWARTSNDNVIINPPDGPDV